MIVDGFGTASGSFTLRVNGACPQSGRNDPRDLGDPASVSVSGSTVCGSFVAGGASCGDGGDNAPDAAFLYTAPAAGNYTIDTEGADRRTFCGAFSRMVPLADGCGTGPPTRNDFDFGINLLGLTRYDPKVNGLVGADGRLVDPGKAQGRMCGVMYSDGLLTVPGFTPPATYYGMIPAGVGTVPPFSGVGGPNHPRYFPSACSSGGESNVPLAAQEIGHGMLVQDEMGRDLASCAWHAPCGGPACPLASFPVYPDPAGTSYPAGSIGAFGLDTMTLAVFPPDTTFDFMSYCGPAWISPFDYRILFTHFRNRLREGALAAAEETRTGGAPLSDYLIASGALVPDDEIVFDPFYVIPLAAGTDDEPGAGEYSLELQDEDGAALFVRHFDFPPAAADEPPGPRPTQPLLPPSFHESLPWNPATRQIVCKRGDSVLALRPVSPSEPSVSLLDPSGGEIWESGDTPTVRWTAGDVDGDQLFYRVDYSRDGGESWRTLARDLTGSELPVDAAFLPGSDQARVRVLASDGVNTAFDESGPFTVARKDPLLAIGGVAEGAIVEAGETLNFIADYADPDEEGIPDAAFVWRAARYGVLGFGPRLELLASELPPGPQQLSVSVPGIEGAQVSARVSFLRAPQADELQASCAGDCDGDGEVAVHELVTGVNIALETLPAEECPAADADGSGSVTIDELLTAVGDALRGCDRGG